jgi:glyoxylase-like metal-dependent hydrolase (beta-lactamase superfamily II)
VRSALFGQNSYLVLDLEQGAALVVDPGFGCAKEIGARLARRGSRLELILLTHEHFDHLGSLNELKAVHGGKVVASRECSARLEDPKKNLSAFHGDLSYSALPADLIVEDSGTVLDWRGRAVRFHPSPGHSTGSHCIEIEGHLFTGDTLIPETKTVVKLPGGSRLQLASTLRFIFSTFPGDTLVHPGHGPVIPLSATSQDIHLPPR